VLRRAGWPGHRSFLSTACGSPGKKLIRDWIPEIIELDGQRAVTSVLDDQSNQMALRAKLVQEAHEAVATAVDGLAEELADDLAGRMPRSAHRVAGRERRVKLPARYGTM